MHKMWKSPQQNTCTVSELSLEMIFISEVGIIPVNVRRDPLFLWDSGSFLDLINEQLENMD